jgi:hypothetical protein
VIDPEPDGLHPDRLEFRLYARGALDGGHAVALLAHCLVCGECLTRLRLELPGGEGGLRRRPLRGKGAG